MSFLGIMILEASKFKFLVMMIRHILLVCSFTLEGGSISLSYNGFS
jgi:hypothetical protein